MASLGGDTGRGNGRGMGGFGEGGRGEGGFGFGGGNGGYNYGGNTFGVAPNADFDLDETTIENEFTGVWTSKDKKDVAGVIEGINDSGQAVAKDSLTTDVNAKLADQLSTHKNTFSFLNALLGLFSPMLGTVGEALEAGTKPTTRSALGALTPGNKQGYDNGMSAITGDQNNAGLTGNYGSATEKTNNGNQRIQAKVSEVEPTINKIPTQAVKVAPNAPTLNPEEAAATAKEEEKKAARQRVGLMQMRAIDPLFMEGLPSIFRSMAR